MRFNAVLSNRAHPEYGVFTESFPIPDVSYESNLEMIRQLEIGDALEQDCHVDEIIGDCPVLKLMENTQVGFDELDYLAKRLDSFADCEMAQFESMASRLDLHSVDELINLTFCCQQVTVVTDFSDLDAIGRSHYLILNGGSASIEEMEKQDFRKIAMELLEGEVGRVTPYGVVFDNDFEMSELYDGQHFPEYHYQPDIMTVEIRPRNAADDCPATYLYLPTSQAQIERAMLRTGIDNYGDMSLRFIERDLPDAVDVALDMEHESLGDLNDMCESIKLLPREDRAKLGMVVSFAQPEYASQIKQLAENLDLFDFAPGVQTPEDYGRYMIQESGHFEYDDNLEGYYDYERYGRERMEKEQGFFGDSGYVSYHGTLSMEELMMEDPAEQGFQMGGIE